MGNSTENENITIYDDDIDFFIDDFKEKFPEADISKKQSAWNACLMHIYKNVFRPSKNLINNKKSIVDYSDLETIKEIYNKYVYLCNCYGREVSKFGFSTMIGIQEQTIYDWINKTDWGTKGGKNQTNYFRDREQLSSFWLDLWENVEMQQQQTHRNKLYDSSNPTGQAILVNHDWGYNMPGVRQQQQLVTSEQLPQLGNNLQTIQTIQDKSE